MTKEVFIVGYALRSQIPNECIRDWGLEIDFDSNGARSFSHRLVAYPCYCKDVGCLGWQMLSETVQMPPSGTAEALAAAASANSMDFGQRGIDPAKPGSDKSATFIYQETDYDLEHRRKFENEYLTKTLDEIEREQDLDNHALQLALHWKLDSLQENFLQGDARAYYQRGYVLAQEVIRLTAKVRSYGCR